MNIIFQDKKDKYAEATTQIVLAPLLLWFPWTYCGLGATYGYWLPAVFQSPGLLHCYGLFAVALAVQAYLPAVGIQVSHK